MTDSELVDRIKRNDPTGLSSIYETYRSEFVHWMMKFQKCEVEDARDFYQAAILILYENILADKVQMHSSSLKTYLFGIGKNLSRQQYRSEIRKKNAGAEHYMMNYILEDAEDKMTEEQHIEQIRQQFQNLGDQCQQVLSLYYFERRSMEEISATLGYKNPETTKNQKYKCMERLRRMVFRTKNQVSVDNKPLIEED